MERGPEGELDLAFPNGPGNIESHSNLYDRFWQPLQFGLGRGEKDADGNSVMAHRYGFHTLRHAAASIFIQHLKWSPKRIQTVMGHSSVRMTFDPYGHLFEDIEKDRADIATIEAAIRAA
jgi:integrase